MIHNSPGFCCSGWCECCQSSDLMLCFLHVITDTGSRWLLHQGVSRGGHGRHLNGSSSSLCQTLASAWKDKRIQKEPLIFCCFGFIGYLNGLLTEREGITPVDLKADLKFHSEMAHLPNLNRHMVFRPLWGKHADCVKLLWSLLLLKNKHWWRPCVL